MKKRFLLFIPVFALIGIALFTLNFDKSSEYEPREKMASNAAEIYGAAEYWHMLRANPETGLLDRDLYNSVRNKAVEVATSANKSTASVMEWEEVGPDNIGGRTRAILQVNESLLLAGGVSGGLFKSTNQGNTWERVPSFNQNMSVSSMAKLGNGNIYVGTGSTHEIVYDFQGSGFLGGGLFVSTDNGATWNYAKDGNGNDIRPASIGISEQYSFFDELAADPNQANKLWVAYDGGLRPYIEGQGFGDIPSGLPANEICEDVAVSTSGNVVLASMSFQPAGSQSTGYISIDGVLRLPKSLLFLATPLDWNSRFLRMMRTTFIQLL
jgi:hypothetical protein